jgi:long-chain acyl-CoA synthetase
VARHKAPRYIWILAEPLPRNASGKFMRRELRERLPLSEAA